jgi:tRNA (guanine9-N1)-methyltransferase
MQKDEQKDPPVEFQDANKIDIKPLSKKERKREQRREAYRENKRIKKILKKELNQEKATFHETNCKTSEHGASVDQDHGTDGGEYKDVTQRKRLKKAAFVSSCEANFHIIIDCNWESDHNDSALKSLTQQVMYCYGINRKQERPVIMHLSGLGPRSTANLDKITFRNWTGVTYSSQDYIENQQYSVKAVEGCKQLVYLTSDAEETLHSLDINCAYIIGGIVDRNRLKGATYRKATAQGVRTAKLPIQKYFQLRATPVLAVNHVFDILLHFAHSGEWEGALEYALPKRKEPTKRSAKTLLTDVEEGPGEGLVQEQHEEEGEDAVEKEEAKQEQNKHLHEREREEELLDCVEQHRADSEQQV